MKLVAPENILVCGGDDRFVAEIMKRRRDIGVVAVVMILKNKRMMVLVFCLVLRVCSFAAAAHDSLTLHSILQCMNIIKSSSRRSTDNIIRIKHSFSGDNMTRWATPTQPASSEKIFS